MFRTLMDWVFYFANDFNVRKEINRVERLIFAMVAVLKKKSGYDRVLENEGE